MGKRVSFRSFVFVSGGQLQTLTPRVVFWVLCLLLPKAFKRKMGLTFLRSLFREFVLDRFLKQIQVLLSQIFEKANPSCIDTYSRMKTRNKLLVLL